MGLIYYLGGILDEKQIPDSNGHNPFRFDDIFNVIRNPSSLSLDDGPAVGGARHQ